jgi:hypothetical protein
MPRVHAQCHPGSLDPRAPGVWECEDFFFESFNPRDFSQKTGVDLPFVQNTQGKL